MGRAPRRADWSWSAGSAGFLLQLGQLHAHPLDLVGAAEVNRGVAARLVHDADLSPPLPGTPATTSLYE
jgi:hypothetical protein